MARSTDEIALIILVALQAEQNRKPSDVRGRQPMGLFTKSMMQRHGWEELEFLQGWGLIMSEKLVDMHQVGNDFYASPNQAGRDFIESRQADKERWKNGSSLLTGKQIFFIIAWVAMTIRLGILLWHIDH